MNCKYIILEMQCSVLPLICHMLYNGKCNSKAVKLFFQAPKKKTKGKGIACLNKFDTFVISLKVKRKYSSIIIYFIKKINKYKIFFNKMQDMYSMRSSEYRAFLSLLGGMAGCHFSVFLQP